MDFFFKIVESKKNQPKKKVRFADDVLQLQYPSSNYKAEGKKNDLHGPPCPRRALEEKLETLPLNWQALYKGIIQSRVLKGHY